jgi:hypothetical protein
MKVLVVNIVQSADRPALANWLAQKLGYTVKLRESLSRSESRAQSVAIHCIYSMTLQDME